MTYDDDPRMRMRTRPGSRSRMPLRVGIAAGALALVGAVGGTAFAWSKSDKPANTGAQQKPSPSASASPTASLPTTDPSLPVNPSCTTNCDDNSGNSGSNSNSGGNSGHTTTVSVPNVTGQNETYARTQLTNKGLNPKVTYVCDGTGNPGEVRSQTPSNGNVNSGSTVNLTVVGVKLPDLTNQSKSYATHQVDNSGLVSKVTQKPSATVKPDFVISTSPGGNSCLKQGTTVTITVAVAATNPSPGTQGSTDVTARG